MGINAISFDGKSKVNLVIRSQSTVSESFGTPIYIPTANGFSNTPGCRETYTATANAICYEYNNEIKDFVMSESITFPMTALEFGGCFQNILLKKGSFDS